eukprot:763602-Hanusia_phi.AAC.1
MNKTLEGEDLRKSSLLNVGLVSGGALLKYRLRRSEPAEAEQGKPEDSESAQQSLSRPEEKMDDVASSAVPEKEFPVGQAASEVEREVAVSPPAPTKGQEENPKEEGEGRSWRVGREREGEARSSLHDLDDSIFELTSEDLHTLEASKKAKEQKTGFKTRKMREEEREKKLSAYPTVVIRVVFPDRTWLQGKFSSQETFSDIYNFVRQALVQKDRGFYLFMTPPPKRIEDSSSTQLKYSQLLPAARMLFAWNDTKSEPGEPCLPGAAPEHLPP